MPEAQTDQGAPQSIADRIANQFGIPDDQPPEPQNYDGRPIEEQPDAEPEVAAEPDEVEIEYEGEKFRLPKKLEKAILQEKDYTQKTQTLSEQRKQVDHERKILETARIEREFTEASKQDYQQLQMLDAYLEQMKQTNVSELPMEDGFKHWMQLQQLKEQREQVQKSLDGKRTEYSEKVKTHLETLKADARKLSGLTDEGMKELAKHAVSNLGYTEADVDAISTDPRALSVIQKAMKYDQLQSNKTAAVQNATPVIKPGGSKPMPQAVKDHLAERKALKSATDSQSKARVIEKILESRFR